MLYALILLTVFYIAIKHISSRYQRVFVTISRLIERDPKELAIALNPTSISYFAMVGKLLWLVIVATGIFTGQWVIVGVVVVYALVGPLITEIVVPLPSQRWYLIRMKRELKKNLDQSIKTGDMDKYAMLTSVDVHFAQAVRKIQKPDMA